MNARSESKPGPVKNLTTVERKSERELYPSKQALDDAIASGSTGTSAAGEQFELLDELLVALVKP